MKKLLLSSIIMLSVCGIATAQTDSKAVKLKQQAAGTSNTAASTPQKAVSENDVVATPAALNDKEAAAATDKEAAATRGTTQTAQKTGVPTVNAAGEVVPNNDAKRHEAKLAAARAANAPATGKQN